jgi:hypothetical protein
MPSVASSLRFLAKHALRILLLLWAVVFLREQAWLSFAAAVLLVAVAMIDRSHIPALTMRRRVAIGFALFVLTILLSPAFLSETTG